MGLINTVTYEMGLDMLVKLALNRKLIPIFGAGFTAGCESCMDAVPNSEIAKNDMKNILLNTHNHPFGEADLKDMDFFAVSDLFFEYVSHEERSDYFENKYTNVRLFQPQIEFLADISWPYAYTLNIDDGIETNSDFQPVLPYHKFRRPKTSNRLLYKLHGDAVYEAKYIDDDQENIIFSRTQYLQAITNESNTDIYQALLADYGQNNLLFVGCKLQDEQDIQYVFGKSKDYQTDTYRIVLRRKEPDITEQMNLRKHGINLIVLVKDSYDSFYADFVSEYKKQIQKKETTVYRFFNPLITQKKGKEESLKLISGANIFDEKENTFIKGELHIRRDVVLNLIHELETNSYVLLKGRRFSGKTYALCSLAERYKNRDVLYFPSTTFIDEDVLNRVLMTQKNSLFLFDSNSLSPDAYALLINYASELRNDNNYMVIATSSSDNNIVSRLHCNVIELKNSFVNNELTLSWKAADALGLTRRKKDSTNIDYLYILQEQGVKIPFKCSVNLSLSQTEKSVIIALCALDKLYYSDLITLNVSKTNINKLCKQLEPVIELVPTSPEEVTRHSSLKLVHNSKLALINILKQFSIDEIPSSIAYIVRKFKNDYSRRRLYIDIILFDTLNQIFFGRKSSEQLIHNVYVELQPLLENDLHYWLQRAKSIYRTKDAVESLDVAYTYAKKAYLDGNKMISAKAALTCALISCAIAETSTSEEKKGYYLDAIYLAYEAVYSEYFRLYPTYLNSELLIGKNTNSERRITEACNYMMTYSSDQEVIQKSQDILNRFDELRKQSK